MARSGRKSLIGSSKENAFLPLPQSFLAGIKRGINFFVVTEEDLAQAGVYLGYFHADESENPGTAFDESNRSNEVG